MHFKSFKTLEKTKDFSTTKNLSNPMDKEERTAFADNIASKFKDFPTSTEDIETEWCLFRTAIITSATNCCGLKRVGETKSSEKRTPWWNPKVKEAIRAKKVAYKAWLANKSSVELRSQFSEARRAAATKVKLYQERARKEFGERLDDNFRMANKSILSDHSPFACKKISSRFLHRRFKWRHFKRSRCYIESVERILQRSFKLS